MKRLVWIALAFLALFAAIVLPLKAEPPLLPVAVCADGVCTIRESDYEQLKAFHKEILESMRLTQQYNEQLEAQLSRANQSLMRAAFCQART